MIIKSGDYVESLHGNVGVVKTVGKTVPVDGSPPPTLRRWCMGGGRKCGNQGVHGSAQSVVQK